MSVSGHLGKKWRRIGQGTLTTMMVVQDRPSGYEGPSEGTWKINEKNVPGTMD